MALINGNDYFWIMIPTLRPVPSHIWVLDPASATGIEIPQRNFEKEESARVRDGRLRGWVRTDLQRIQHGLCPKLTRSLEDMNV